MGSNGNLKLSYSNAVPEWSLISGFEQETTSLQNLASDRADCLLDDMKGQVPVFYSLSGWQQVANLDEVYMQVI